MGTQPKSAADEDVGKLKRLKRLGFESLAGCLLSVPKSYLDFTRPERNVTAEMLGREIYVELRVSRSGFGTRTRLESRNGARGCDG